MHRYPDRGGGDFPTGSEDGSRKAGESAGPWRSSAGALGDRWIGSCVPFPVPSQRCSILPELLDTLESDMPPRISVTFLLLVSALVAAPSAHAEKPNIIVLLADDLGWNDVGYRGSPIATPNIDGLARDGVILDRFYSQPVCTPTRAAILTGRAPVRMGLSYTVVRPWANYGLPQDERLLVETLRDAGYATAIVGKWHLGHDHQRQLPHRRGFDRFYGHLNGAIDYFTHERLGGIDWQRDGRTLREEGYTTDLLGREAVQIIESHDKKQPLLLYLPFNAPHSPMQAPADRVAQYDHLDGSANREAFELFASRIMRATGVGRDQVTLFVDDPGPRTRATYAAMVDSMDRAIGAVLDALRRRGMSENSIVLFTSDNGGHIMFGANNSPLRGEKTTVFEGGIRVPAVVRWPAGLRGGRRVSQTFAATDVFPTLLAAAGVELDGGGRLDGQNLWPQIGGEKPIDREIFFAVGSGTGRQVALRHGPWKLIRRGGAGGSTRELLFDVEADPEERNDRAAQEPARVADLRDRLERWIALHPQGGAALTRAPHPGWIAPEDWAAAVRGD